MTKETKKSVITVTLITLWLITAGVIGYILTNK